VNRRPGHVDVTTEVGFCNFCNRTRNLRREEHHLGALVRIIVSCETCHRTLSSSVGVASTEPEPKPATAPPPQPEPARVEVAAAEKPKPKRALAKRAPAKRATKPKATGKAKVPAKPRSTATRRTSRKK